MRVGRQKKEALARRRIRSRHLSMSRQALLKARATAEKAKLALEEAEGSFAESEEHLSKVDEEISRLDLESDRMIRREALALGVIDSLDDEEEVVFAESEEDLSWLDDPALACIDWSQTLGIESLDQGVHAS